MKKLKDFFTVNIMLPIRRFINNKIKRKELTERGINQLIYYGKIVYNNYKPITMAEFSYEEELNEMINNFKIKRKEAAANTILFLSEFTTKEQEKRIDTELENFIKENNIFEEV